MQWRDCPNLRKRPHKDDGLNVGKRTGNCLSIGKKSEPVSFQLRAIEILLRKCVPDLAAAEIKSEQTHRYVVEVPPVLDRDEWQRKHGQNPSLPPQSLQ